MLTELGALLLSGFVLNNIVLVQMLGAGPFFAYQAREDAAIAIGFLTSLALMLATAMNYVVYHFLLVPFQLHALASVFFLLIIAALVHSLNQLFAFKFAALSRAAGIHTVLIISNCAVLGISLNALNENASFITSLATSFAAALGFCAVLALVCCLQERLACAALPKAFQGAAINLITLGFMALALLGFSGIHLG